MPTLSQTRKPLRSTVLSLALAAGLCLASAGTAAAAERFAAPDGPATTFSASTSTPPSATATTGPSFHQKTVEFTPDRIDYRDTASGFDAAGAAYFEQTLLTVGGPDSFHYSTTRSHS
ncbi:hypothetical protein [Streptomyces sp. NPDC050264]|uniref:hypothetical protein n=1 Tax=Streptomyces sp. NPDC050264 TaxID=3155038 RepID=UPI00343D46EB